MYEDHKEKQKKIDEGFALQKKWDIVGDFLTNRTYILDVFIAFDGLNYSFYDRFWEYCSYVARDPEGGTSHLEQKRLIGYLNFLKSEKIKEFFDENEKIMFHMDLFNTRPQNLRLSEFNPLLRETLDECPDFVLPEIPKEFRLSLEYHIEDDKEFSWGQTSRDFYIESNKEKLNKYNKWLSKYSKFKEEFHIKINKQRENLNNLKSKIIDGDVTALNERLQLHLKQNEIFLDFVESYNINVDERSQVLEVAINLINLDYPFYSLQGKYKTDKKELSKNDKEKVLQKFLKFVSLRIAFASSQILQDSKIQIVCINIYQKWFDEAIGSEERGVTTSFQVSVKDISKINLEKIDVEKSFKHFKGINTPHYTTPTKIRPIFQLSKDDNRIVSTIDVMSDMVENQNLALMEWEDFEHLVAQLFELEFTDDGSEVKVTQSSRDKGVDAIVFDPNPLKGGKYVLQAKRYTNVVGVSAVRDLYGTIMNEGANRGILITTSSYGPDAYEFAKDKPISLVDGPNLINLLNKHKMKYKIDLKEARDILDSKKIK